MKKCFGLLLLMAWMASCTNYQYSGSSVTKIANIAVSTTQWQYTGNPNNNYFYYTANVPALTEDMFDNGKVEAYVVYDRASKNASQHVLPWVRHYEEYVNDTWNFYTETVDCTYGIGWIEFTFRSSDFIYEVNPSVRPNDMDFRVVMTR